jgi:hypothetical protein
MKKLGLALFALMACDDKENIAVNNFTGNEIVYLLEAGSEYTLRGTATIKEKVDGSSFIIVQLSDIEGSGGHPVHLHLGPVGTADAAIAALLSPILDSSGKSETVLKNFSDESPVTYSSLLELSASIKIHLATSGLGRDVILAAGNIGSAVADTTNAKSRIAICR